MCISRRVRDSADEKAEMEPSPNSRFETAVEAGKRGPNWLGVLEFAFVVACNTLSLLFWGTAYLLSFTWLLKSTGNRVVKRAHQFLSIFPVIHLLAYWTVYEKHFNRAKVVFVCYTSKRLWADVPTMLMLMRWYFREPNLVIGNLYWGGAKVGNSVLVPPLTTFDSPAQLQPHLQWALDTFKDASFALSGQLPAVCSQMGLRSVITDGRVVDGRFGTVALTRRGAERGIERLRKEFPHLKEKKMSLCVLGGGGYTGREIGRACGDLFENVYLVDSKFERKPNVVDETMGPSVVGTSDGAYAGKADVVLVFLPYGDLVKPYIKFAHGEQVWIDDTHPPIPLHLRKELKTVTNLFRLTARFSHKVLFPPLPNWKPQDLPGCLLTGMAVAMNKEEFKQGAPIMGQRNMDVGRIKRFIEVVEEMGIELGIFDCEKGERFKLMNMSVIPEG